MRWKGHLAATTAAAFPCAHSYMNNIITYARFVSTSSSSPSSTSFPFPAHRNPTPHQIFHLPSNASQAEIKGRCTSIPVCSHPLENLTQQTPIDVQITSSRGHSIQTRQLHRLSPRACAMPVSTLSQEPTTFSVGRHRTHVQAKGAPQTTNTWPSLPADDANTPGARRTVPIPPQDARRRSERTMRGKTR